jgi:uncharacterized protein YwqG
MNRAQAIDVIRSSPFAVVADKLILQLRQAVRIRPYKTNEDPPTIGTSRIVGFADLPSDFVWPRWMASGRELRNKEGIVRTAPKDTALDFVAQIRLEEVPKIEERDLIPPRGMLYFFFDFENQPWGFDPADRGGWRVIYLDIGTMHLVPSNRSNPDPDLGSRPCAVVFTTEWTLPNNYSQWDWIKGEVEDWEDTYADLINTLRGSSGGAEGPSHRLLGWPMPVQNDMELECQLVSNGLYCGNPSGYQDPRRNLLEPGSKDWRLLLQIDTDEEHPGWMWGDCGRIYYWMREAELRQRQFDSAWFVLQCG